MARKGLGKGLDSLIPNFYDEDFDSNSPLSLEDMLNDSEETVEEVTDDVEPTEAIDNNAESEEEEETAKSEEETVDDVESKENTEEIKADEDDEETNSTSKGNRSVREESPEEEKEEESQEGNRSSEDISGDNSTEDSVQTSREIQIQKEHVEEVKKIVDKNPRITLWSSRSSAVFRYLRKTEPEFSISKEASVLIEEAVSKKYPEIWALFDED